MDKGNLPLIPSNLNNEQTANIQGKKVDRNIFVANKNSDVYHNLDCKWAKKIKPENIIEFNSTKEAEIQNFLPCRSCNPDGIESAQTIGSRRETMSISSYR
jgi:methylphosphotriester-DNA--protein-cysteine methyltransferase